MARRNLLNIFILLIVSLMSVADLFFHAGRPITFDGHIHMTTMAQFAAALQDGEFPVRWSNGFANYGLPLPLFAHQLPAYIGAAFILVGSSVVTAYNLTLAVAVMLGAFFFYMFLRRHVSLDAALVGGILFALFPYRIINIYIRGALPELTAAVFFPLLLISVDLIFKDKNPRGYLLLIFSVFLLAITHPMMLIVFGIPTFAYLFFSIQPLSKQWKKQIRPLLFTGVAGALGIVMASYYLIPLFLEMKYFFQGVQTESMFNFDAFFGLKNFIDPNWYYYYTHPGPRGNFIKLGVVETLLGVAAIATSFWIWKKKSIQKNSGLVFWTALSIVFILFTLKIAQPVYQFIPGFDQLQYPWRFLNGLQFSIPIIAALLIDKFKLTENNRTQKVLFIGLILFVFFRMPQLYGKNFGLYSDEHFYYIRSNLHSQNLNPIWSENSENYPRKTVQAQILEGTGNIEMSSTQNASRDYRIYAESDLKLIDYTFYFPGWKAYIDGQETPIEFQDINHRGVITYKVPVGTHSIQLEYTNTKVRKLGLLFSALALSSGVILSALLLVNPRNWVKILTT